MFLALVCLHCEAQINCSYPKCSLIKVSCLYVTPEDCKPNEVFVPRDNYCNCCDACVPKAGKNLLLCFVSTPHPLSNFAWACRKLEWL